MCSFRIAWPLIACLALLACQAAPQPEAGAAAAGAEAEPLPPLPPFPPPDSTRYRVDPKRSDARIIVYRGGPLARYGHNHVVRIVNLSGEIHLARRFRHSAFKLVFPVQEMEVDPADARNDEGSEFAVAPSPQAVESTRTNMLGPAVLDAGHHPEITLQSVSIAGPEWGPEITARIALRGVERDLVVPVAIEREAEEMSVTGMFMLRTSDFGMTPFSVLGGGLQVQDAVKVRFRIIATSR